MINVWGSGRMERGLWGFGIVILWLGDRMWGSVLIIDVWRIFGVIWELGDFWWGSDGRRGMIWWWNGVGVGIYILRLEFG